MLQPTFHKTYDNESEELRAYNTVCNEILKIREFNKQYDDGTVTFHRKLWKHSDRDETKRRGLNSGFRYDDNEGINRRRKRNTINYPKAPESFDWRSFNVLTPVQDQGYSCQSCYAFSTTGAIEALFARNSKKLVKLSEQQILDCNFNDTSGNWGCNVKKKLHKSSVDSIL